jgi:CorA-like Mg2+ transporter protein
VHGHLTLVDRTTGEVSVHRGEVPALDAAARTALTRSRAARRIVALYHLLDSPVDSMFRSWPPSTTASTTCRTRIFAKPSNEERISDMADTYRDLLSGALDAYMSVVSNRLNDMSKQLTIIATIFLPLSYLTGFFGQNFGWLVDRIGSAATFFGVGVGTEVVAVTILLVLLRRQGWMGGGA